MKRPLYLLLIMLFCAAAAAPQKRNLNRKPNSKPAAVKTAAANLAFVIDERLAVLRRAPSLFAAPLRRLRRGRNLFINEVKQSDGVTFYRVTASRRTSGWLQSEAVAARARRGDDARLVRLIQASEGFEQIERMRIFLDHFASSPLRPAVLLLLGDLMEEHAGKMSLEAARRLSRREMAASGAPLHSFYLNYASLDRYQRLGIGFRFNPHTRRLHYNGAGWAEIIEKYPRRSEAEEARKRLAALAEKLRAEN